jgi:dTDP-4-dehydrorhamnose reductase
MAIAKTKMKILLFGKDGQVGRELRRSLSCLGDLISLGRKEADLQNLAYLRRVIQQHQPDVVVNAAAYTAVDNAESDDTTAHAVNVVAVGVMAEEAAKHNAWLVHYSTDYVYEGTKSSPYVESDVTAPISVYGKTKREGDELIRKHNPKHLIFRTSWVYAAQGRNFIKTILSLAQKRDDLKVIDDQFGAPTSAGLIADVTALGIYLVSRQTQQERTDLTGTYHLVAAGETNWFGVAQFVLERAQARGLAIRVKSSQVQAVSSDVYSQSAKRPRNSRMATDKIRQAFGIHLPHWHYHLDLTLEEILAKKEL